MRQMPTRSQEMLHCSRILLLTHSLTRYTEQLDLELACAQMFVTFPRRAHVIRKVFRYSPGAHELEQTYTLYYDLIKPTAVSIIMRQLISSQRLSPPLLALGAHESFLSHYVSRQLEDL